MESEGKKTLKGWELGRFSPIDSATEPQKGLKIRAELDRQTYPTGIKIAKADLAELMIEKSEFHGEWNYCISPRPK